MPNRPRREDSRYREQAARLAALLQRKREEAGLTQQQVAEMGSISIGSLRSIEQRKTVEPGYFTVLTIADVLGIPLDQLDDAHAERPD